MTSDRYLNLVLRAASRLRAHLRLKAAQIPSEAEARHRLVALGLVESAAQAGQRACEASLADAAEARQDAAADAAAQEAEDESVGTHRCPHCGYRFEPDPVDFYGVGPLSRRSLGDGSQDQAIDCRACGRQIAEESLEEL